MTEKEIRELMAKWIQKLLKENIFTEHDGALSLRYGDSFFITPGNKKISTIGAGDLLMIDIKRSDVSSGIEPDPFYELHREIYSNKKDINTIIHSHAFNTVTSSMAGKTVYPMLDDLAQIVGSTAKSVDCQYPPEKKCAKKVLKSLKRRSAALIKDHGALCCAGSIDDAWAVAQVLEKGCKSFIETSFIGGGVKIKPLETNLMRLVYVLKYSKADTTNR